MISHGTIGGYSNHACRCRRCREAWTAYNKMDRQRRIARGQCIQCTEPRHLQHVRCKGHYDACRRKTAKRLPNRRPRAERLVS